MIRALFAFLLCVAPAAVIPAEATLPIDYFTRHDDAGEVKISPDGEYYALTTRFEGAGRLSFLDVETMKKGVSVDSPSGVEIDEFYWASPVRVVYTLGRRYLKGIAPSGEISAIDRDGKKHARLFGYQTEDRAYGEVVSTLKRDARQVIISESSWTNYRTPRAPMPRISFVDTYSASVREIETLPLRGAYAVLDEEDRVRFAVGFDGNGRRAIKWRPAPGGDWAVFDPPGFLARSVYPERFTRDGRAVYFLGTETGDAVNALYRLEIESGSIEKLYQNEQNNIAVVVSDLADLEVVGVGVDSEKPQYHWLDPEDATARTYGQLERAFPGQFVAITSVTDDQSIAIVHVSSDINPGEYYKLDRTTRRVDSFLRSRSWVEPSKMRPMEPIKLTARDGLALHGYLTRPRDAAGPYPLIVLPHGGPHGIRDRWGFDWEVQLLAHYGYAVLQVNFRGSGGYGEAFERSGYLQWGLSMQDDITDATRWAVAQGIATEDNICIYGASYGGYAALMSVAREPTLYRCAVGYVGVYDLELLFEKGDTHTSDIGVSYLEEVLGTDSESLHRRSPVYLADRIQAPVLLIHGKEDWRADFAHAKRMRSALEKAGRKVAWLAVAQEGHGVYDEKNREEVYGTMLAFFGEHLRQAPPLAAAP